MAQACTIHKCVYNSSPVYPVLPQFPSTSVYPLLSNLWQDKSFLDGRQPQPSHPQLPLFHSFRRKFSANFLRALKYQTRSSSFQNFQQQSNLPSFRAAGFGNQTGRMSWKLEDREVEEFMQGGRTLFSGPCRRRGAAVVAMYTLPRPLSFLPSAGPLRDFLFATVGAVVAFLFAGILARIWCLEERYFRAAAAERGKAAMPEMGSNPGQKETVEWVNMVIHKIWKVYRRSLEVWLVDLLQPAIDNLGKPDYVKRVEIAEFCLDYEPLSVRNVQHRASRRANDLQYQFGLRYTGGARCLLNLKLGTAGVETSIPVGVYDLDVDAELWLKLRLAPVKPYVGTLSIAFVQLPTIKLVLAPFRLVNLFSIPFLSRFLSKLLTIDLPRLLVLPRHITFDFLPQGQNALDSVEAMKSSLESGAMDESLASGVLDLLKSGVTEPVPSQAEPSDAFVGELTVTVCEARDLPIRGFTGWSNPYCILALGDQVIESKRNKETSHPAGHNDPVWNQDFQFLVEDPWRQKLMLRVRDSTLTLNPNIGYCQISLADLKDCVPRSQWVPLTRESPFGAKKVPGHVHLALTYKSFVDEDEDLGGDVDGSLAPYIKVFSDSSAGSDEEIGTSLGEEIASSLREEASGRDQNGSLVADDDNAEVVQRQSGDVSIEVTSTSMSFPAQNGASRKRRGSTAGGARGQNGAVAGGPKKQKEGGEQHLGVQNQALTEHAKQHCVAPAGNLGHQNVGSPAGRWDSNGTAVNGSGMQNCTGRSPGSRQGNRAVASGHLEGNTSASGNLNQPNGTTTRLQNGSYMEHVVRLKNLDRVPVAVSQAADGSDAEASIGQNWSSAGVSEECSETVDGVLNARVSDASNVLLNNEAIIAEEVPAEVTENDFVGQPSKTDGSSKIIWLCLVTTMAYVLGCSLHISNPLHP